MSKRSGGWFVDLLRNLLGFSDHQAAKQAQTEAFEDEESLSGATLKHNRKKILSIMGNDPSRLLSRGSVGDTCFHLCFLFPSPENLAMAKWLLSLCPELINATYGDIVDKETGQVKRSEYNGENALHMAIANGFAEEQLEWLIRLSPALVRGRADGVFFRPGPPEKVTCAWGETPLSFAVSLNKPEVVRLLVEKGGADMLQRDTDGNSPLHLAVIHKRHNMVVLLSNLWDALQAKRALNQKRKEAAEEEGTAFVPVPEAEGAIAPQPTYSLDPSDPDYIPLDLKLTQVTNNDGYTPLVLAAKLGNADMFMYMWKRSRSTAWAFSYVTAFKFPLEHVDDIWDLIEEKQKAEKEARRARERAEGRPRAPSLPGGASNPQSLHPESLVSTSTVNQQGKRARTALQLLTDENFDDEILVSKDIPVLRDLLDLKWKLYAGPIFLRRFAMTVFFLLFFAIAIMIRGEPLPHNSTATLDRAPAALLQVGFGHFAACSSTLTPHVDPYWWWRLIAGTNGAQSLCYTGIAGEVIVVVGTLIKLTMSLAEWRRVGTHYYFRGRGAARLERFVSLAFSASIFGTILASKVGEEEWSLIFLSFASILGHFYILWFLLGWKMTGPFVVMLWKMFMSDLARFLSIAVVLLLGFSQAFFVQLRQQGLTSYLHALVFRFSSMVGIDPDSLVENQPDAGTLSTPGAAMEAANVTDSSGSSAAVGGDGLADAAASSPSYTSYGLAMIYSLSLAYVLLANVVLLNLLIAMMADTYSDVKLKADSQWFLERARIILQIEATMTNKERLGEENKYYGTEPRTGKPFLLSEWQNEEQYRAVDKDAVVEQVAEAVKQGADKLRAELERGAGTGGGAAASPRTRSPSASRKPARGKGAAAAASRGTASNAAAEESAPATAAEGGGGAAAGGKGRTGRSASRRQ